MKTDWLMMMSNQRITLNKNPFVRCIAFSLLVFLGLWTVQHFWLIGLRRYRTLDLGTLNKVISGNVNADILVVGSSRAQHGFDPRIISRQTKKSVYNIGLDGTQIDLQAALFFTYLRHNRKPEFLILSLDVHNLSSTRDRDIYHSGLYMADLDEPDLFPAMKRRNAEWTLYKFFPLIGIATYASPLTSGNEQLRYEATRGLFRRELPETLFNGFAPVEHKWTTEFDEYKKQHPNGVSYEFDHENIQIIRTVLKRCQNLGINVVLVYSPEYFENQTLTTNRHEIFSIYRGLAKEFGIPLWDYSDSDLSHDKANFYNSQHLNAPGAKRFSEDLALRVQTSYQP